MSELPKGWTQLPLSECAEFLDSQRVPVNAQERARRAGSIPYYGATGQVGFIDAHLFDEELVLVGEDGAPFFDKAKPIAYVIHGKSWVNNHAHVVRADTLTTSNLFLKYYLDSFDFHGFVSGTTRLKLPLGRMRQIPVMIPPLAEQRRIVAEIEKQFTRLDAVEVIASNTKRKLLALAASLVSEVFELPQGLEWKDLGTLITDGPQNGLYKPAEAYGQGVPIVRIDDIRGGIIRNRDSLKLLSVIDEELATYGLHENDILINRVNSMSHLGKSAIIPFELCPAVFESNMMRLRVTSEVQPHWVSAYLNSRAGRRRLTANAKQAINQASINQRDVKNTIIPTPPLDVQIRKLEHLADLDSVVSATIVSAELLTPRASRLRQAILSKAFCGKLVSQDPNDEPACVLVERVRSHRAATTRKTGRLKRAPTQQLMLQT